MKSYFQQLSEELDEIKTVFRSFLEGVTIKRFMNDPYSNVFILIHEFFYNTDITNDQKKKQIELLQKYTQWEEHFDLLTRNLPKEITKEIDTCKKTIKELIELKSGWGTKATIEENIVINEQSINKLQSILSLVTKEENIVLVPDTNALIIDSDFGDYKKIEKGTFTILLNPTVLSELDKLKINHRDEGFRTKIDSIIRKIKGLRSQGSLLNGVIVNQTITIRMSAKEPDFAHTLSWLYQNNNDDRIIAFTLECLRNNPAQKIILVTADINLQNKAEMAKLPYSEPPSKL